MRTRGLVVDDEPDLLELVHYNLTKAGYDVALCDVWCRWAVWPGEVACLRRDIML